MSHKEGGKRMGYYPWYETASGEKDLWQGDITNLCPIIVPFGTI